ncbi:MAG TPA: zf-HC2 domain-containing protein [Armatimonadaceae bacterium]|nr:zf-HC2 domain-containing protein [Armatimonadaceae bacterium]
MSSSEPAPSSRTEPQTPRGGVTCESVRLDLTRFRDGELDERQFGRIRAHLLACPECRAELSAHETLSRLAREWRVATPDLWSRVAGRLDTPPSPDAASVLAERQEITDEQARIARYVRRKTGERIEDVLLELGFAGAREIVEARALAERVPFIDLRTHGPEAAAMALVPAHTVWRHHVLPVKRDGSRLWVAMNDPRDAAAVDEVERASGCVVVPLQALPGDLEGALREAYGVPPPAEPPRPPTAVGAPAPTPDEDAPPPSYRTSFWSRFGQRVADALPAGNPTPQQLMEARGLLRRAADEIDAMLASAGHAAAKSARPATTDDLAEVRREIAGLREEVAALRRQEHFPAATATVSRYVEAPPDLMPYAPPSDVPTPLT